MTALYHSDRHHFTPQRRAPLPTAPSAYGAQMLASSAGGFMSPHHNLKGEVVGGGFSRTPVLRQRWCDIPMDNTPLPDLGSALGNGNPFNMSWIQQHQGSGMSPCSMQASYMESQKALYRSDCLRSSNGFSYGGGSVTSRAATKVLFLRNLPSPLTENDLYNVFQRFGSISNTLHLAAKNVAFVEFDSVSHAQACFYHYQATRCEIYGKQIDVLYSGRDKIVKRQPNEIDNPPNSILLVTVRDVNFPVTVDVLLTVFSAHGPVKKIVIFARGFEEQAFIEFDDVTNAKNALDQLDGRNIYAGCNLLKICFSSLKILTVKQIDERHWNEDSTTTTTTAAPLMATGPETETTAEKEVEEVAVKSELEDEKTQQEDALASSSTAAAQTTTDALQHQQQQQQLRDSSSASPSYKPQLYQSPSRRFRENSRASPMNSFEVAAAWEDQLPVPVVLVKNLEEDMTEASELAALFAIYGDVVRAKIMFNKRNTALVQMASIEQCQLAIAHLQFVPLHGRHLGLEISKGGEIPPVGRGRSKLSAEFDDSNYARHKGRQLPIFPPCSSIHLSNLPDGCTEEILIDAIKDFGKPKHVKFICESHRMAVVTYASLESAVRALVGIHAFDLNSRQIRCAFARHSGQ
eukprot:TRINITY_DN19664_c0_g2_i10.p1 TRINITY_DN19664_c0_g2~~TRINITY_DN19664_c0_g2_i10.p1  ORF type:complete len:633 (-),score=89.65 TRINITY_DN19664_c0_g2_i10:230-2128(-)